MDFKPKLIIIGGYLGAGKTTLLSYAAKYFQSIGESVGLITNDQTSGLVDTMILVAGGSQVQEISGSCFCCNFEGLVEAARYLKKVENCSVIIAEPVGSCTDLSATIMQPLKMHFRHEFDLAPLSVVVDPFQFHREVDQQGAAFNDSLYIYRKQMEEADYLLVSKVDLLDDSQLDKITKQINCCFKGYNIHFLSSVNGMGFEKWTDALCKDEKAGTRLAQVDYDTYAKEEAEMGWYNGTFMVGSSDKALIPWKVFNVEFVRILGEVFKFEGIRIGHIKTFLKGGPSHIVCNLTRVDDTVSCHGSPFASQEARFVLNVRAETDPRNLNMIIDELVSGYQQHNIRFDVLHSKYLSPRRPQPTHRHKVVTNS